ncbi:MAG: sortase [Clostridia bacterium]|nr:sortase [Clostridia bacterium]
MEKKYNKVLNIVLIVGAILMVALLAFWGYKMYQRFYINKSAGEAINDFIGDFEQSNDVEIGNVSLAINDLEVTDYTGTNGKLAKKTYKGFTMDGYISIPKINLNYPVLDKATAASMDVAVGINYGPGLNKVGNTVIMGHNSSNGTFFSDLFKLANGDSVYITDNSNTRVRYVIYNMYESSAEDLSYFTRDTSGKREISLSTCKTNDTSNRLVIWAREVEQQEQQQAQ